MHPLAPRMLSRRSFVACLASALALPGQAQTSPLALLPMLARDASSGMSPAGWLVSEKYDGVRALWDGRELRFRSGRTVPAPAWFLAGLPAQALDGELWLARGRFGALSGSVRREKPRDDEWRALRYMVFDLPRAGAPFEQRAVRLGELLARLARPQLVAVVQQRLPDAPALSQRLNEVLAGGGEGLMLHRADAPYVAGRTGTLLKLKPVHDAEASVIGHVPGRGKYEGRLGSLHVRTDAGVEFLIGSGLSDAQRAEPPPVGSVVTYIHRSLTPAGVPRFASFVRVHEAF